MKQILCSPNFSVVKANDPSLASSSFQIKAPAGSRTYSGARDAIKPKTMAKEIATSVCREPTNRSSESM